MSPCVNDSSTHVHCSKLIQFTLPRDNGGLSGSAHERMNESVDIRWTLIIIVTFEVKG